MSAITIKNHIVQYEDDHEGTVRATLELEDEEHTLTFNFQERGSRPNATSPGVFPSPDKDKYLWLPNGMPQSLLEVVPKPDIRYALMDYFENQGMTLISQHPSNYSSGDTLHFQF